MGRYPRMEGNECSECGGNGRILADVFLRVQGFNQPSNMILTDVTCPECGGTGRDITCDKCRGRGFFSEIMNNKNEILYCYNCKGSGLYYLGLIKTGNWFSSMKKYNNNYEPNTKIEKNTIFPISYPFRYYAIIAQ